MEPEKTAFWQMILSVPLFFAAGSYSKLDLRSFENSTALLAVFYQGVIVGGLGFTIWAHLLRHHAPGLLTFFNFAVPLFGVILSAVVFREAVTLRLACGIAAVLVGIRLAVGSPSRKKLEGISAT